MHLVACCASSLIGVAAAGQIGPHHLDLELFYGVVRSLMDYKVPDVVKMMCFLEGDSEILYEYI